MKYLRFIRLRARRLLLISCGVVAYFILLVFNAQISFQHLTNPWLSFGFSSLTSLMFFSIGALVYLYARNRIVAILLFCLSLNMMVLFVTLPGQNNNILLHILSGTSSAFATPLFFALILVFPKNCFALLPRRDARSSKLAPSWESIFAYSLVIYLGLFALSGLCLTLFSDYILLSTYDIPHWLRTIDTIYYGIGLLGVLSSIIFSYSRPSSLREKQLMLLFVFGVIFTVVPVLMFTVVPQALNMPYVDGQVSSVTVSLFPVILGYSILRYQFLVLDSYIRRAVTYAFGLVCLALLVYIAIALFDTLFSGQLTIGVVSLFGVSLVLLAPLVWWLARFLTERFFFSEILHYRRLLSEPTLFADVTLDVEDTARLITSAAIHTFEIPQVCLFVLDDSTGCYHVLPPCKENRTGDPRCVLLSSLLKFLKPDAAGDWLEPSLPALESLMASRRPMLLSEAIRSEAERPRGLNRYLISSTPLEGGDWLLAPVRAQGKLIGLLVLGERADKQPYAGPDFEVVQLLLTRFSSMLETARMYARATKHASLLNSVYSVSTTPGYKFQRLEEVAQAYVQVATRSTGANAEIWLYNKQQRLLYSVANVGPGPRLGNGTPLPIANQRDWQPWFSNGDTTPIQMHPFPPACLAQHAQRRAFPLAWLPLQKLDQLIGVLVLSYPRPHRFQREEMRVLELFASQCAATFENVRMTLELFVAYERQKELDVLKDQFIMTASHELRTPLTAVQGYIELLSEYRDQLTAETRMEFVEKAQVSCDELALLVGNIMDASRVRVDIERSHMRAVSLTSVLHHVLNILDTMIKRERRMITFDVQPELCIMADEMRLRQVLLNLMSNALKYSTAGTPIEIHAQQIGQQVRIAIRDYGHGVPPQDRQRLFERFTRLERDMNSPVRGAGLGLYICKQLVEAMGGHIRVESSGVAGEGSVFLLSLHAALNNQERGTPVASHSAP